MNRLLSHCLIAFIFVSCSTPPNASDLEKLQNSETNESLLDQNDTSRDPESSITGVDSEGDSEDAESSQVGDGSETNSQGTSSRATDKPPSGLLIEQGVYFTWSFKDSESDSLSREMSIPETVPDACLKLLPYGKYGTVMLVDDRPSPAEFDRDRIIDCLDAQGLKIRENHKKLSLIDAYPKPHITIRPMIAGLNKHLLEGTPLFICTTGQRVAGVVHTTPEIDPLYTLTYLSDDPECNAKRVEQCKDLQKIASECPTTPIKCLSFARNCIDSRANVINSKDFTPAWDIEYAFIKGPTRPALSSGNE